MITCNVLNATSAASDNDVRTKVLTIPWWPVMPETKRISCRDAQQMKIPLYKEFQGFNMWFSPNPRLFKNKNQISEFWIILKLELTIKENEKLSR